MTTWPAVTEAGQGDTAVLLLHGIGGRRSIWGAEGSGTLQALAAGGYRAVAVDLPGYGDSAAMGAPDMDAFVAAVRAVMQRTAAPRTVLLGHSMGGMVAQELVARSPAGVDGLVLTCTSAGFGRPDGAWQARFIAQRLAPLDAGLGMAGMVQALLPGLLSPGAGAHAARVMGQAMSSVPEATYRAALGAIAAFDRVAALAAIAVPTLMLAAELDRTASPELMQRMAARVPGCEFQVLAGTGHVANVEAPERFNAAVLDFLRRRFPVLSA
jgi:pimeloyl-ACP methyl ester carboxylesterase